MIAMSIDNASVASIVDDIKRLDAAGKKTIRAATNWAGVTICTSLASRTKVAKKKRKIVTQKMHNVAMRGVIMYRGNKEVFFPLAYSKNFNAVPLKAPNGKQLYLIKPSNVWVNNDEEFKRILAAQPDNMNNLIIKMAGLAKRSWRWLQRGVKSGGEAIDKEGGKSVHVGSITWSSDNLTIHNRLGYIQNALQGGNSAVSEAIEKAAKSFKWKVDELLGVEHGVKTQ